MDIQYIHDAVDTVFAVMLIIKTVYVQCHPTIAKNVVKTVVIHQCIQNYFRFRHTRYTGRL